MKTAVAVVAMVVSVAFNVPSAQAIPFEGCGELIPGVEGQCVLFKADSGGEFVLGNLDGFHVGDRVCVAGQRDPSCITACQQGIGGCILDNTITPQTPAECVVVAFDGTAQGIAKDKNGQISIHVTCDSIDAVVLGPPDSKNPRPHPTYARITSLLDDGTKEYVDIKAGVPLQEVCLKERKGSSEDSAVYEASVPDTNPKLAVTRFQIKLKRKAIKAKDCALGMPCSRYDSQIRVDRAAIEDTTGPWCAFTTTFEILRGTPDNPDGTCPPGNALALTVSKTAPWTNPSDGDCKPPKLRTPVQ